MASDEPSKVVVLELPASCDKHCKICATPLHGIGNPDAVRNALNMILDSEGTPVKEIHLVSNGETGRGRDFQTIIADATTRSIPVSVACADPVSVVPGLVRVEVSATLFTIKSSHEAILKALKLNLPVIVTLIDDGKTDIKKRLEKLRTEFDGRLAGYLIRALQAEGLSTTSHGTTSWEIYHPDIPVGVFPVHAFQEFRGFPDAHQTIRINSWGQQVPFLRGYVEEK